MRLIAIAGIYLSLSASVTFAECAVPNPQYVVKQGEQFFVETPHIDNRIVVTMDGNRVLRNLSGNGDYTLADIQIDPYFHSGDNTLKIEGFNEAYPHNGHDPNPGKIVFEIIDNAPNTASRILTVTCNGPDHRKRTEVKFADITFTFFVP